MNLVLVALDTLRADHLGCYGYARNTSPFLDRFAQSAVLFENYFATTVPTHPSFTTLFTGMDAFGHQVVNVRGEHPPAENIPLLAETLQEAGFQTAAVDTMGLWMSRGFQVYENPGYHVDNEQPYACGHGRTRRDKNFGAAVTGKAAEVAAGLGGDRPFFLFVHYWDPHQPYYPPAPYHELYYTGNPCDPRHRSMRKVWAFAAKDPWHKKWMDPAVTDADYWVAQYDSEINYTDDQVKALFEVLQQTTPWDETLVVVLADHGEIMSEHAGEFDHEGLYEAVTHVPLLVRLPGSEYGGRRVSALTCNLDVMPTVLDLLGVPQPETVEGMSLVPVITGAATQGRREIYLAEGTWQCKRGLRTHEWKFIRALSDRPLHNWHADPPRELYWLPADPDEQTNLIHVRPRVAAELEQRLETYLGACENRYGHPDPIAVQGPSFGRWALKHAAKLDADPHFVLR